MSDVLDEQGTSAGPPKDWGPRGTVGVSFASALSFEAVTVRLGGRMVLDRLDLSLNPGEIVCLLGESGSGKSTVLRAAAGIQRIESGIIRINDRVASGDVRHMPPEKRGVGLMFQDFALFPHLTLLENVAFGLSRLSRKEAQQHARATLRRVGLLDREADYPHKLSGGQQQRLALARTIAPRPGILLLDEPFSGLDARLRESVRGEMLAVLRETRATSLIVTHDPEEAMLMGDRIALLRRGRIVQIDTGAAIYGAPADLAAARFMSPLGEISGRVRNGGVETPFGTVPTPGHPDGTRVVVALRPVGVLELVGEGRGVPGRVVTKRSALGVDFLEISIAGMDDPVHLRRAADRSLVPGNDVHLRLRTKDVLVFAED